MCGIFFYSEKQSLIKKEILNKLIKFSEKRGLDNLGICFKNNDIEILKTNNYEKKIYQTENYKALLLKKNNYIFGQCRLVTDGPRFKKEFNQPIVTNNIIGTHNGIILNNSDNTYSENIYTENDTKKFYEEVSNKSFKDLFELEKFIKSKNGIVNIIFYNRVDDSLYFFSNNGSLYFYFDNNRVLAASERYFLEEIKNNFKLDGTIQKVEIDKLCYFDESLLRINQIKHKTIKQNNSILNLNDFTKNNDEQIKKLIRCKKCILPETYPLIKFNLEGVCNYCETYSKQKFLGDDQLIKIIGDKKNKILFGLSGGRDSCFGLYYLYEVLGYKNITTYTYDWGLTTDTARKNISHFCSKYKIENLIRSADISKKRSYIGKNIYAWLKKPHLGMVPLFFIGDKPFLYYGSDLKRKTKSDILIHGTGCQFEQMEFKVAYCGINQKLKNNMRMFDFSFLNKIKLFCCYALQFIQNPRYINSSIIDNIIGFYSSFIHQDKAIHLYNYVKYNSTEIDNKLKELGFITDKAYGTNQWRAGDGQTAFTNYIYYQVGGFSEFDNYRSNQIREGILSRKEAINLTKIDNKPRLESISNFCNLIGLNTEEILLKISNIKKRY